MIPRHFSNVVSLINDLLDRYEKSGRATRPRASIDNDGFTTVDQRDAFDETLCALERNGGLDLIRTGRGSERLVTGARLKNAELLYAHLGRQPVLQQVEDALAGLRRRHSEAPLIGQMLDSAAAAWGRGVSFISVARNDVRTLEHVIGLAQALYARLSEAAAAEVDFRTFSRLAVGDSKALERNVRGVMSATVRLFGSDRVPADLEPEEFLGSVGVKRLPQPVLIRGPLTLAGERLPEIAFLGVPSECVDLVELASTPDYILTIENYASFVRYVREVARSDNGLVVFSGGFPSRPTLDVITRLAKGSRVPTYHWGDMDAGGVRIFHHIERRLRSVGVELRPHMMSADLLRRVGSGVPGAARLTRDLGNSALAQLANAIRATGLVHEQEELTPQRPSDNLNS